MCALCELNSLNYGMEEIYHAPSTTEAEAQSAVGVSDLKRTGNLAIDSLISGWQWPEGTVISYGFPGSADVYPSPYLGGGELDTFSAVSTFMQETFKAFIQGTWSITTAAMTLTPVMGFTNLTLVEDSAPDANTDILVGATTATGGAHAYYPGQYSTQEGDIWFGPAFRAQFEMPATGNYGFTAAMHELGHALGLKHPFGKYDPWDVTIPGHMDSREYSIMSYSQVPFSIVFPNRTAAIANAGEMADPSSFDYAYPQTFMMLDIAALQELYGANYTFRADETVYTWSSATGETFMNGISQGRTANGLVEGSSVNKIYQTIWDGGGIDTYDLSNYATNLRIDLRPGEASTFSEDQLIFLMSVGGKPYYTRGNVYNALLHDNDLRSLIENARGGSGNDSLKGNLANNQLWGGSGGDTLDGERGDDFLDGGDGFDTAVFSGNRSDYAIALNLDGSFTIVDSRSGHDGSDTLLGIEFARFADQTLALQNLVNHAPTNIRLSGNTDVMSVQEGSVSVGQLTAEDQDDDPITWSFDDGAPDGGNAGGMFVIDNGTLKLAVGKALNFESGTRAYTVQVKASDGNGGETSKAFTISVTDVRSERLIGTAGADRLLADIGNDVLDGRAGADVMAGGVGNDTYHIDNPRDRVIEMANGGTDTVHTKISHTLAAHVETLVASGAGALALTGNSLANTITGNAAANRISGGAGNDRLYGGAGNDRISGGAGADKIIVNTALNKSTNLDTLTDFNGRDDAIWLENAVFGKLARTGALSNASFTIGSAAKYANDHIVYNKATGVVSYDVDGSGRAGAVAFLKLQAGTALSHTDFYVV